MFETYLFSDPFSVARLPFGKVLVAIANKHARQAWAMLAHGVDYDPHARLVHPMAGRARDEATGVSK